VESLPGFQALVLRSLDSLYGYAVLLARPPEDPEDLLQESLLRAFGGFASFDASQSFKPWMLAILRRTWIDRQRRRKVRLEEGLEDADTLPPPSMESPLYAIPLSPEDLLVRREAIERVRDGIRRLPHDMREVVELRDIEGLSYQEIAAIVHRPVGTVMSRLFRGRNLLRTYLVDPQRREAQVPNEL